MNESLAAEICVDEAKLDVLKAIRVAEAYCYDAGAANAARNAKSARNAVAELIEAAEAYYSGYCQDEAAEDGCDFTGCTREQHEAAARLRDALARCRSS